MAGPEMKLTFISPELRPSPFLAVSGSQLSLGSAFPSWDQSCTHSLTLSLDPPLPSWVLSFTYVAE